MLKEWQVMMHVNKKLDENNDSVDNYPKEKCNEDIGCQIEPCLLDVRAICTPPIFLLSEPNLEALKWHATHRLHSKSVCTMLVFTWECSLDLHKHHDSKLHASMDN
jgi:hypothetical protein